MRRAAAAAVVALCACADVDAGPNVATSLQFASLPFPAVVAGDSLRDTSGAAAPLRALAFNSGNDAIVDAPVRYAALESTVTVDSITGFVVAGPIAGPEDDTTARVVAYIGGLQSPPLTLRVVPRPDAVSSSGTIDTLRYSVLDSTKNLSGDLTVRVAHAALPSDVPVRDWVVAFALETPADSVRARIVGENGRAASADTTTAAGLASRKVRLYPAGLAAAQDSIVVLAIVRYRGAHLAGSPVRLVLPFRPLTP